MGAALDLERQAVPRWTAGGHPRRPRGKAQDGRTRSPRETRSWAARLTENAALRNPTQGPEGVKPAPHAPLTAGVESEQREAVLSSLMES